MLCVFWGIFILSACSTITKNVPVDKASAQGSISVIDDLPTNLPPGVKQTHGSPFVIINADSTSELAASLIVPVPLISDVIINKSKSKTALKNQRQYLQIKVYQLLLSKVQEHPSFVAEGGKFSLYPMVFMSEGSDDVYRLSLMFQVTNKNWMGRYYYHLPTSIPTADLGSPSEQELKVFEAELEVGAEKLMTLIDQMLNDELAATGQLATVGSLYIVGGKIGGMVSPEIYVVRNAEILAEKNNDVILRLPGDLKADANAGGLAFGVHYFNRDQLHTFEKQEKLEK